MADLETMRAIRTRLKNRRWRLNNLYRIVDERGHVLRFVMNDEQCQLYEDLWYFNVILKARQLGFSTFIQLYGLDFCLFNSNKSFGIIAQSREDAEEIFEQKIKYAYEGLPEWLKAERPAVSDSARELKFNNGSHIRVGTSLRGGTFQMLHVSEFGKIAARYPEKAKEIMSGALNTIHTGQFAFIESTAEGAGGDFHDLVKVGKALQDSGARLTPIDPKLHFFPWWMKSSYRLDPEGVAIPADMARYFERLRKNHGITLDAGQMAWYVRKAVTQKDLMKREFPSTPDEPFEVAIEGAYYANEMARVRKEGRITKLPVETKVPINTFWDLGRNDSNAIWLHQRVGQWHRFIGYYEDAGENLGHYANWLREWLPPGCTFGTHYLPHDGDVKDYSRLDNKSRKEVLEDFQLGEVRVVGRIDSLGTGIEMVRNVFASCMFDEEACAEGLSRLDGYRKDWDEKRGDWKSYPREDKNIHGADAFRTFAQAEGSLAGKIKGKTGKQPRSAAAKGIV